MSQARILKKDKVCRQQILAALLSFVPFFLALSASAIPITGWVQSSEDQAIADARVELRPVAPRYQAARAALEGLSATSLLARTRSDEHGFFRLDAPEEGVFEIRIERQGHVSMIYRPLVVIGPTTVPEVLLPRDEEALVSWKGNGALASGIPVTDLFVVAKSAGQRRLDRWGWQPASRRLRLDAQGLARFQRAEGEQLDVAIFAPGSLAFGHGHGTASIDLHPAAPALMTREWRFRTSEPQSTTDLVLVDPSWNVPVGMLGSRDSVPVLVPKTYISTKLELLSPEGAPSTQRLKLEPQEPSPQIEAKAVGLRQGRVLSTAGTAIANALVVPSADPGAWQRTDDQGRWAIPSLGDGVEHWHVAGRGFASQVFTAIPTAGQKLPSWTLQSAKSLAGRVRDPAGHGLARTIVTAHKVAGDAASLGPRVATAISDARGSFVLEGLSADSDHLVRLRHPQHTPQDVLGADAADLKELVLPKRQPAFGRVVNLQEEVIAGARVAVIGAYGARVEGMSNEDGVWQLAYLPAGELTLEASAAEYATFRVPGVVPLPGHELTDLGVVVLGPELALDGKVVDSQNRPIESAEVFWTAAESEHRGMTLSDPQGGFQINGLGPGSIDLMVSAEGFLREHRPNLRLAEVRSAVVALTRASAVTGRVLDIEGDPVADAQVVVRGQAVTPGRIEAADRAADVFRETVVKQDGRFEIGQLPPGKVEVVASADGYQGSVAVAVELRPGEPDEPIAIELRPGVDVRGRIVTDAGRALVNGRVSVGDVVSHVGAEGAFQLSGLAPGAAELSLWHEQLGHHTWSVDIDSGMAELELEVEDGLALTGTVVDSDSMPVAGAKVQVLAMERAEHRVDEQVTDEEGHFRAAALMTGRYRFLASHPELGSASKERFLSDEIDTDELVLELPSPAVVRGRLIGLEAEELAAASVQARHPTLGTVRGSVDSAGGYRIRPLAPGAWHLIAEVGRDQRRAEARVRVEAAVDLEQDLSFEGLELTGQVRLLGEALPKTRIHLRALDRHGERRARTDENGLFQILDLAPGNYRVTAVARRQAVTFHRDVEIFGDQYVELDMDPASVDGRVVDPEGDPVASAVVRFEHRPTDGPAGSVLAFSTDAEGRFHISKLAPGPYFLQIRHAEYEWLEKQVALEAAVETSLELQLDASPGLELRVHLPADAAIPARPTATVALMGPAGEVRRLEAQWLDDSGEARFTTLPEGEWDLWVRVPGTIAKKVRAEVPGPVLDVELEVEAQLEVSVPQLAVRDHRAEVRLHDAEGQPFATIDERGLWRQSWFLDAGQVRITGLPPGSYTIHVNSSDGDRWRRQATLTPGDGNRFELLPGDAD